MNNNLLKRSLSRQQAISVATSQTDAGSEMQENIITALCGPLLATNSAEFKKGRAAAYRKLDPLSRYIVDEMLLAESLDAAFVSLEYAIANLENASLAIL